MTEPANSHHHYHGEEWHTPRGRAIREVVFGMNDGLVTTIGFVAGVSRSFAKPHFIALAGAAEVIAGAVSMAVGAYLSTKSQSDFFRSEIARETREIRDTPEHEIAEAREIYTDMGFQPDEVEMIVKRLRADPKLFLRLMLRDELGITDETLENPVRNAIVIGGAFFVGALPPLIPFLFASSVHVAFRIAVATSIVALFVLGAGRTRLTKRGFLASGMEVVAFGVAATVLGYFGGMVVAALLGGAPA